MAALNQQSSPSLTQYTPKLLHTVVSTHSIYHLILILQANRSLQLTLVNYRLAGAWRGD
jgi:hypothetical protein